MKQGLGRRNGIQEIKHRQGNKKKLLIKLVKKKKKESPHPSLTGHIGKDDCQHGRQERHLRLCWGW